MPYIDRMTEPAARAVQSVQPYNGAGQDDWLWVLHDLWNQDKHRFTPLVSIQVWTHAAEILDPTVGPLPAHGSLVSPLLNAAGGAKFEISEVKPYRRTLVFSALSNERSLPLFQTASEMLAHVHDRIVPLFAPCFP